MPPRRNQFRLFLSALLWLILTTLLIVLAGLEVRDVVVPYFKAGLENNEQCLWVTGEDFNAEQARSALRAAIPDFDKRERKKQVEIADGNEWYGSGKKLQPVDLVGGLLQREQVALGLGYAGLRTNGNCAWVLQDQWTDFLEYKTWFRKRFAVGD